MFWTWISVSRAFQPVLGRIFHVESEFEVKNKEIQRPGAKIEEKRLKLEFLTRNSIFLNFLLLTP